VRGVLFKAFTGRGQKRTKRVQHLYIDLLREFEYLKSICFKFSKAVLYNHAKLMIESAPPESRYQECVVDTNKMIFDNHTLVVALYACQQYCSSRTERKAPCQPLEKSLIEKSVAFHLGELKR